ncbi:gap junction protein alpha 4 [Megalops cyprinoides]|uniref:gap junction protein alpha 4 n=1 Tax=Megalops cyprinoides TaxID=118141 RepID=UPI001863F844|nr:gap junction protein alpha 4 [Megalops cyprinoides]
MSRADWSFLEHLLEEGQEYSTGVGRVWLTVLFLFRMLVLGTAAESAWDDEQSDFDCNTQQPGCELACYDQAFPISHFRYFVLQVIFVSTPTIFYFLYVAVRVRREQKHEGGGEGGRTGGEVERGASNDVVQSEQDDKEQGEGKKDGGGNSKKNQAERPVLKGKLLGAYTVSIVLKVLLEVGFIMGLWYLYGFVIHARHECKRWPCPHTVDCFVSRPTEKTIFTIYMQAIAAISVLLNIVELLHLLQRSVTHHLEKKYLGKTPVTVQIDTMPSRLVVPEEPALSYHERGHLYLPMDDAGFSRPAPESGLNWAVPDGGSAAMGSLSQPLPSYSTCMRAMKPTSHRPSSKDSSHSGQSRKSKRRDRDRDLKHKQYV